MLIALTLEKLQLSKLLIALTQGCRSDTRKHQELTENFSFAHSAELEVFPLPPEAASLPGESTKLQLS
jgi:hypothetical protein